MKHLVSVYITTKNRLTLLKRCINSVQKQSYSNIEIIVVDDGSEDCTAEYLKEQSAQGTLKSILNDSSIGACASRNKAIDIAEGKFITGMDDDDYMEPWRIEKFVNYWHSLVSTEAVVGLFDDTILKHSNHSEELIRPSIVTLQMLRKANLIGNQVFVETEKLRSVGKFDPLMPALQDWDTWLRYLSEHSGHFANIHEKSYIQDVEHDAGRITLKKASVIREAFSRLEIKLSPLSFSEKIAIAEVKYDYPQMRLTTKEILLLFRAGRYRKALSACKKKIIN